VNRVEVMISQNESFQSILDTSYKHRVIADGEVAFHYVNVTVSAAHDNVIAIDALFDSGAENFVIRSDVVKDLQYSVLGSVTLKAFDGHCSKGVLTTLNVKLSAADDNVSVRFVVCNNVSHPCLLSLSNYRRLLKQGEDAVVRHDDVCVYEHCNMFDENVEDNTNKGACVSNAKNDTADAVHDDESVMKSDACDDIDLPVPQNWNSILFPSDKLADEQKNDNSVSGAFKLARKNKGGYFLQNNLRYHRAKLLEQTVERLVVPCDRRKNILDLAHNLVGGHIGIRRTKDKIALSFMWPNLTNDVIDYCRTCEICQRRARITCKVPIQGGVVSVEPVFSHFYVDCLGPLCAYSVQYNYTIVFLDQVSRYPHCVPLRSITAKNCCDAMLSFWQHTGFPTKVTMDRATNFFCELTRHFF